MSRLNSVKVLTLERLYYVALVLAFCFVSVPPAVAGARVELTLTLAGETGGMTPVVAQASARSLELGAASDVVVQERAHVPGTIVLELPRDGAWQIEVTADGFMTVVHAMRVEAATAPLSLELWPAGRITGMIAVEGDHPLPLNLIARYKNLRRGASERTTNCPVDPEGKWSCVVEAGSLDLRIKPKSFVAQYFWDVVVSPGTSTRITTTKFLAGASIAGWVVDEDGRAPRREARVTLTPYLRGARSARALQFSDALISKTRTHKGFFHFDGVRPGVYTVTASAPDRADVSRRGVHVVERTETELLGELVLEPPRALEVRVSPPLDPSGRAWRIVLWERDVTRNARDAIVEGLVSPDGLFRRGDLGADFYEIEVKSNSGQSWTTEEATLVQSHTYIPIELAGVTLVGVARLGEDPIAATLTFQESEEGARFTFHADEEGRFGGPLSRAGDWRVRVRAKEPPIVRKLARLTVPPPAEDGHTEVEVVLPDTRIAGQVIQEDGARVGRAIVMWVAGNLTDELTSSFTDERGAFEIRGIRPGPFRIMAQAVDEDRNKSEWRQLAVVEGLDTTGLLLILKESIPLTGRILSPAGPVVGAAVNVVPVHNPLGTSSRAMSDLQGYFEVDLPSGTTEIDLQVAPPGFALTGARYYVSPGDILEVPVSPNGGTLFLDLAAWAPSADWAAPRPILLNGESVLFGLPALRRWARGNGKFEFSSETLTVPNVAPGDYTLCLTTLHGLVARGPFSAPAGQCVTGYLPLLGSLELVLPGEPTSESNS